MKNEDPQQQKKPWRNRLLPIVIVLSELMKLLSSSIIQISIFSILVYYFIQTFFLQYLPSYYDFRIWYGKISTGDKISFMLLASTIAGFFVTLYTLSITRKRELFTKVILTASDELHITTQSILSALNAYEYYFTKVLDTNRSIRNRDTATKKIAFWISYLATEKEKLKNFSAQFAQSINSIYSINAKHGYIHLLENVATHHARLAEIAGHIHLECLKINIVYLENKEYDFEFFAKQIDAQKLIYCIELIRLGRNCIAKLSGFINGKYISHIAPTRLASSFTIIQNVRHISNDFLLMNDICTIIKIDELASINAARLLQDDSVKSVTN